MKSNEVFGCLLTASGRAGEDVTVCVYAQDTETGQMYRKAKAAFAPGHTTVELDQETDPANPVLIVEKGDKIIKMPVNKNIAYVNDDKLVSLNGIVLLSGPNIYLPNRAVDLLSD